MPELLMVDDIPVELRLNTRRRTRIAVNIDPAGHVVLDAPTQTSLEDVEALVREHARWLRFRVKKIQQETAHLGRMGYKPGEVVLYLGDPLQLAHGQKVSLENGTLTVPTGDEASTRTFVRDWYGQQADLVFAQVMADYLHLPWLQEKLPPWRHQFMKSQWGSCSAKGVVALNTHLVRTPRRLIEYVVLHELCHLRQRDHSRRFHALMTMHMFDWSRRSQQLRQNLGLLLDEA